MTLQSAIVAQFRKPHGALGHAAGWIMARRPSNRLRNRWTVEQLELRAEHRVLELGCGPGLALKDCAALVTRGRLLGLDHSATMLKQARARLSPGLQTRVELRQADVAKLHEFEANFDRAYSINVVQFVSDRARLFSALFELLAPGGLIATTYQPRHRQATRSDALRLAEAVEAHMDAAGFTALTIRELPLEPVPAVCVLGRRA